MAQDWSYTNHSAVASPLSMEQFSSAADFEAAREYAQASGDAVIRRNTAPTTFGDSHADMNGDSSSIRSPESSGSSVNHMELAAGADRVNGLPRHMRTAIKPARPLPTRTASDGIRKKNTRIEIPAERNLLNIDELIEKTTDEEILKELKAQRRLLRNREAALASRQRKKQHTEDLEIKERNFMKEIASLQNQLHEYHVSRNALLEENSILHARYANACQAYQGAEMQKEELIVEHNKEVGRLRQQINFFKIQLTTVDPRNEMVPVEETMGGFASDMGALSVDAHGLQMPVDPSGAANDVNSAYGHLQPDRSASVDVRPSKRESELPVASGVLFMILLCGAYVASQAHGRGVLPRLPDEVRVASSTVLHDLLQDSATDTFGNHASAQPSMMPHDTMTPTTRSMDAWGHNMHASGRPISHRAMTMPTSDQTTEQLFSVTPAEYASLTTPDSYLTGARQTAPPRNLAQTLGGLRQESMNNANAAEVYSRSLLWDEIPPDVIRQFRELLKESRDVGHTAQTMPLEQQPKHEYDHHNMWHYNMDSTH